MKIKHYCANCKLRSDKRYCHCGILMNKTKKYCKYKTYGQKTNKKKSSY